MGYKVSEHQWHNEQIAERVIKALRKNGFEAEYYGSSEAVVEAVDELISPGMSVGIGGSVTLQELNIPEKAAEKGAEVLNHNVPGLEPEVKLEIRRKQLTSDLFLCSTNGLTLDGHLVNIDGTGNRVAAMTFGPKQVVVIAGVNKIVKDEEAAFQRIRFEAAPKNNKRLNIPNPCASTGTCEDCAGKTRICNIYSVIRKRPSVTNIKILVVGEDLGF